MFRHWSWELADLGLHSEPLPNTEVRVTISKPFSELNIRLGWKAALVPGSLVPEAWRESWPSFQSTLANYRLDCVGSSG